jgi:hypothetical protein
MRKTEVLMKMGQHVALQTHLFFMYHLLVSLYATDIAACQVLLRKPEGKTPLGHHHIVGRTILRWTLKK